MARGLVHAPSPFRQLTVVTVDSFVATFEMAHGGRATLVAPEIEPLDEVMHEFVSHRNELY